MRFSFVFQQTSPARETRREELARETAPQPLVTPAQDLPDDLDARARLAGERQRGEG